MLKCVELLIQAGAYANQNNIYGWIALMYAANGGHTKPNTHGDTALMRAA